MSKAAATTVFRRRMPIGRLCAALSVLAPLTAPPALATTSDPALRRSEQLDTRRIGKVSQDERSVLRVEWRAGLSSAEETSSVQEMLDSLRRMEGTVVEINRLLRSVPVQRPATVAVLPVVPGAPQPSESDDQTWRIWLANIAAGILVALWWFRRRKPAKDPEAAQDSTPGEGAPATEPLVISPTAAAPAESFPVDAPILAASAVVPPIAAQQPAQAASTSDLRSEARRIEPRIASDAIAAAPAPIVLPAAEPVTPPKPEEIKPAPPPPAETPVIDFLLEEADPETVARENAKTQKPRKNVYPAIPETTLETNVEPTLQLAEIMLSMGLEQGAAQALLEYTEANPRQAVYHWLKLLGIYRKRGQQAEFVETAEKLRKHFNVQAEDWVKTETGETPTLEKFPRVADQVQKTWLQPAECISYLKHLLEDNRDGARAGFPQAVAEEFLLLMEILKETSGVGQSVGL